MQSNRYVNRYAYLNYKTGNETSHCLNEFWQDLCLGLRLVLSIKGMAKTLVTLSEAARPHTKSTWQEGGKPTDIGNLQGPQRIQSLCIFTGSKNS